MYEKDLHSPINHANARVITQGKNVINPANGVIDGQFSAIEPEAGLDIFQFAIQDSQLTK